MQEVYGLEDERVSWTALGFPGGIGRSQSVCGALTGGIIAIGLDSGRKNSDFAAAYAMASQRARQLYQGFEAAFDHTDCRSLIGSIPDTEAWQRLRSSGLMRWKCRIYVEYVVRTLVEEAEKGTEG